MAPFAGTKAPEATLDDEAALEDALDAADDEAALDAAEEEALLDEELDTVLEAALDDDGVPSEPPPPPPPHAASTDANRTAGTRPALMGDAILSLLHCFLSWCASASRIGSSGDRYFVTDNKDCYRYQNTKTMKKKHQYTQKTKICDAKITLPKTLIPLIKCSWQALMAPGCRADAAMREEKRCSHDRVLKMAAFPAVRRISRPDDRASPA